MDSISFSVMQYNIGSYNPQTKQSFVNFKDTFSNTHSDGYATCGPRMYTISDDCPFLLVHKAGESNNNIDADTLSLTSTLQTALTA